MGLWGGHLDDTLYQASVNMVVDEGIVYQVHDFWNGVGSLDAISSARIVGCINQGVELMDANGQKRCELTTGKYVADEFISRCGNDVVTQYKIRGKLV